MTSKIFRSTLLVAVIVLICSLGIVMGMLYPYFDGITAQQLSDGSVLRISTSQASSGALVIGMFHPIIFILIIAVALSAILARRMAKRIVQPLNTLDLDHPLENNAYEELSPLLGRINQLHQQVAAQMQSLKRKNNEFQQITGSMKEGLVLLDSRNTILSINPTARTIFDAQSSCIGKNFLTLDRSREMTAALEKALDKGHSALRMERKGREYQFDISRIESDGAVAGSVILAFDITEQLYAERNRREFSANVSHELKTPLQSIIGSAELLENGLVKEEDTPRFVGHIRKEAARLVDLIEDIIRLSSLDEEVDLPKEPVALRTLAQEVTAQLQPAADKKGIAITVNGEDHSLPGVRRLLYEILYNLCDNAIKYNREGGSITVTIGGTAEHPLLSVADTGIGIPQEHQSRVFERFYRVDKSHSKASGGTGLGLSIVKHAAAYHGGSISLSSIPGKGTTVTIQF